MHSCSCFCSCSCSTGVVGPRNPTAGVANHGPMLGWAIANGHKINWSASKSNWMPYQEGTPEDRICSVSQGTGSMSIRAAAEAIHSSAGQWTYHARGWDWQRGRGHRQHGHGCNSRSHSQQCRTIDIPYCTCTALCVQGHAHARRSAFSVHVDVQALVVAGAHGVLRSVSRSVLLYRSCTPTGSMRTTASLS